jgi:lysophospholipase L1-like esterase
MHGWAYSEQEYKTYFPFLVSVIRKKAPGARLVWASTTPIRQDQESGATNGRIVARNAIAAEFVRSQAIPIDDLHSFMLPHTDMHTDNVHFSKEGSALMAEKVARAILDVLPLKPPAR